MSSPLAQIVSFSRKDGDTRIDITIGNQNAAKTINRHIRRLSEVRAVISRLLRRSQAHQELPVVRELMDLLPSNIGNPDVVIRIDRESMGHNHQVSAPTRQGFTGLRIQHQHRMSRNRLIGKWLDPFPVRPVENEDMVMTIDSDSGCLSKVRNYRLSRPICNQSISRTLGFGGQCGRTKCVQNAEQANAKTQLTSPQLATHSSMTHGGKMSKMGWRRGTTIGRDACSGTPQPSSTVPLPVPERI